MNTTDYENIWQKSLIHVTDEFALPPVVLQAGEAIIGTLGNFSVSTGKAKAKKTFLQLLSMERCWNIKHHFLRVNAQFFTLIRNKVLIIVNL